MDWIGQAAREPPPGSASTASPPDAPSPASLPYCGDLDAARRARDSHAVRLLTQLRDQASLSPHSSPSSRGLPCLPAASQSPAPPPSSSPSSISSMARRLHDLDLASGAHHSSRDAVGHPQPAGVGLLLPPPPIIRRQAAQASGRPPAFFGADATSPTAGAKVAMSSISVTGAGFIASSPGVLGPTGAGDTAGIVAAGSAVTVQQRRFFAYEQHPHEHAGAAAGHGQQEDAYGRGGGVVESKGPVSVHLPSCCCPSTAACGHSPRPPNAHAVAAAKDGRGRAGGRRTIVTGSGSCYVVPVTTTQPPTAAGEAPDAAGEALLAVDVQSQAAAEEEATIEDPVLMARVPLSQSYLVECSCAHRFGMETLYGCIKAALCEDLIPACPLANHPDKAQRCNYLLSQKEVEHVLNRYMPVSQLSSEERRLWRFRRGRLVDGRLGWVSERVSEAFLRKGKIAAGCMECPNGRCGYWVEPTRPREKQRVDCPKCLTAFCTLCKRPYHYRCSCDEVMTITKQWLEWQQHGREPYLQKMAAEDSSYQAALDTFNNRREAHVQEVHTAEQNWALLVADENYKASRCRRCPHCHRVIERIDGCDTMVCGQNAHGGNLQNGCGQGFNWNEAHFYFADIGEKRSIKPFEEVPPPEIARVTHQIMDGAPIKCDICQAQIQGPLAMCINCPTFNCCIRCQNKHTRGHILRLYMDNSYHDHGQPASTTA